MLFKEMIAVYSENHTKQINTFTPWRNAELLEVKLGGRVNKVKKLYRQGLKQRPLRYIQA
jgi:hypothetical protein